MTGTRGRPMTNSTYTVTISDLDTGDPKMDANGVALLYGVTPEEVRAIAPGPLPPEWIKRSVRRAKEAQAHGHTDLDEIFAYWARKDHDAELELLATPRPGRR